MNYGNSTLTFEIRKSFEDYVSSASECRSYNDVSNFKISNPHSNSILDLNGDCAGDLFITSMDGQKNLNFEIWLMNPNDGKFCLVDVQTITPPISSVSFGDISNFLPKYSENNFLE